MKKFLFNLLISLIFITSLVFASCDNTESQDGKHPIFIKAENLYNEGDTTEAYKYYEKYYQLNPKSAKAVYKLALISQDRGDYIKAIYYYERYLSLDPHSGDKEAIQKWIDASRQSLIKEFSKESRPVIIRPMDTSATNDSEIVALRKKNQELNKELLSLKENSVLTDTSKDNPKPDSVQKQPQEDRIYTVKEGDSLYKISREVYGSSKYYKQIIDANREKIKGNSSIRVGDKLSIPPLKNTN